jgi:hypothetical protein
VECTAGAGRSPSPVPPSWWANLARPDLLPARIGAQRRPGAPTLPVRQLLDLSIRRSRASRPCGGNWGPVLSVLIRPSSSWLAQVSACGSKVDRNAAGGSGICVDPSRSTLYFREGIQLGSSPFNKTWQPPGLL